MKLIKVSLGITLSVLCLIGLSLTQSCKKTEDIDLNNTNDIHTQLYLLTQSNDTNLFEYHSGTYTKPMAYSSLSPHKAFYKIKITKKSYDYIWRHDVTNKNKYIRFKMPQNIIDSVFLAFNDSTKQLAPRIGGDIEARDGYFFSDSTIIIQELYKSETDATPYAYSVMMKKSGVNNTSSGFLWTEFEAGGKVIYKTDNKGKSCVGCHSKPDNLDLAKSLPFL